MLLLDEPFGALDAKVRKELRRWLRSLHDELGFTSVFVTHDQDEALELSDRVVVMSNGRIEQIDSPVELYAQPNSRFVFDFFGNVNQFAGEWQMASGSMALPLFCHQRVTRRVKVVCSMCVAMSWRCRIREQPSLIAV